MIARFVAILLLSLIITTCRAQQLRRSQFACHNRCSLQRVCPTSNQIFSTVAAERFSCRSCIRGLCGFFNSFNRLEEALCIYRARRLCGVCFMDPIEFQFRSNCQLCLDRCEASIGVSSRIEGGSVGAGGIDGRNLNTTDREVDQESGTATSTQGRNEIVPGTDESSTTPEGVGVQTNTSQGQERQAGTSETTNVSENNRRESGERPVDPERGARPGPQSRPEGTRAQGGRSGSPDAGTSPPCNCFSTGRCPSQVLLDRQLRTLSSSCQNCISRSCEHLSFDQNRQAFVNCVIQTRPSCRSCPPIRGRLISCRSCLSRCPRPNPNQGGGSIVVTPDMPTFPSTRTELSCREACTTNRFCPRINAINLAFRRFSSACRNCASQLCGGLNRGNRQLADCRFQARMSCEDCKLNERELAQRERCHSCIRECSVESVETTTEEPSTSTT